MSHHKMYLVAVDGSEWSDRAVERAVHLAQETDAALLLVTVIPWSGYQPLSIDDLMARPLVREAEEKHAKEHILDPLVAKHGDSGVTITARHEWGNPVPVLQTIAREEKANMVFVGRRGRSKLADLMLGSVANSLAHCLGVPIVLVP